MREVAFWEGSCERRAPAMRGGREPKRGDSQRSESLRPATSEGESQHGKGRAGKGRNTAEGRRNCEFQLLRYVPDAVRNEYVHIGVILREEGSGPVVTAGSVVSGLERMFISVPPFISCRHSGRTIPDDADRCFPSWRALERDDFCLNRSVGGFGSTSPLWGEVDLLPAMRSNRPVQIG